MGEISTTKVGFLKKNELYRKNVELDLLYNYVMDNLAIDGLSAKDASLIKGYINKEFLNFNFAIQKVIKSDVISHLVIPLVNNCNLNCKHCDAFAPLCKKDTYNNTTNELLSDIERLQQLGFKIKEISLEGGEPLLYKDLINLCKGIRRLLTVEPIVILTNGKLLHSLDISYWKVFADYDISIIIDNYFKEDSYLDIRNMCKDMNIHCEIHNSYSNTGYFYKAPIDLKSIENDTYHYLECEKGHRCLTMLHGFLYICGRNAYINNFNAYFNTELPSDGIDIRTSTKDDIVNKISSPSSLCKYCCYRENTGFNWSPSNRDIEEWVK